MNSLYTTTIPLNAIRSTEKPESFKFQSGPEAPSVGYTTNKGEKPSRVFYKSQVKPRAPTTSSDFTLDKIQTEYKLPSYKKRSELRERARVPDTILGYSKTTKSFFT